MASRQFTGPRRLFRQQTPPKALLHIGLRSCRLTIQAKGKSLVTRRSSVVRLLLRVVWGELRLLWGSAIRKTCVPGLDRPI